MGLKRLAKALKEAGIDVKHMDKDVIEKLLLGDHDRYHDVIKQRGDHFYIEVFIKNKPHGEKYTREEYKECKHRKGKHVEHLNSLNIGITFNQYGDTTKAD